MPAATYSVMIGWDTVTVDAFTIGVSTLGGGDVLVGQFATSFAGTYDDVTAETKSFRLKRGRDDNLDPMTAGDATIVLTDPTGKFNPKNTASVLAGSLIPMRPVRIQATFSGTTTGLWRGFIRSIEHDPEARESTVNAVDLFLWLSRVQPVVAAMASTTTGAAIGAILDAVGFTDPAFRSLDAGDAVAAFSADGTATALSLIEGLLEAERGVFYMSATGVATYEDRNARALRTTTSATLAGVMQGINPSTDLDRVRNRATVTKTGGAPQTAYDADSAATYGYADHAAIDSPYLASDAQALSLAGWLVAQRKDPRPPARGMTLANTTDAVLTQILARELQDRVTVTETVGGTTGDWHIEQIQHEVTDGGRLHRCAWALTERGADVFVLGVSTLGGGDTLAY